MDGTYSYPNDENSIKLAVALTRSYLRDLSRYIDRNGHEMISAAVLDSFPALAHEVTMESLINSEPKLRVTMVVVNHTTFSSNRINAIRAIRGLTDYGLRDAKNFVESLDTENSILVKMMCGGLTHNRQTEVYFDDLRECGIKVTIDE